MLISVLKKYIWIINLILLVVVSYTLAQIVNDKIKADLSNKKIKTVASLDKTEQKQLSSRSSYDVILKRNIFGLQSTSSGSSLIQDAPQTTLNLELLGTAIEPGVQSIAIIKNLDTDKVRGYMEGDSIDIIQSERVKLAKIENCRALVERNDGAETIQCKKDMNEITSSTGNARPKLSQVSGLDRSSIISQRSTALPKSEAGGVKEVNEGEYEIDQKMLDELLGDPNQLLTQARVIPQEDGLRFFAIRPNSVFFLIGLRNGDILHKINDVELSNVENALSLFEELRGENQFNINLTRRGQKFTYEYTVK